MGKRLTEQDYHNLAASRDDIQCWLGPMVARSSIRTGWLCICGNEFICSYGNIQFGRGCPECGKKRTADARRIKPGKYIALAKERSDIIAWLGPEVSNSHINTLWECECGNRFLASYNNIRRGRGCPLCARKRTADATRHSTDAYHGLVEESDRVSKWIGPEVKTTKNNTFWICSICGEIFEASFEKIRSGYGCDECGYKVILADKKRLKLEEYHILADANDNIKKWLGPEVNSTVDKTYWLCSEGHTFFASYANIYMGKGCPDCANISRREKHRHKSVDYHDIAQKYHIKWVGNTLPDNSSKNTLWECACGEVFESSYRNIYQGCSYCNRCSPKRSNMEVLTSLILNNLNVKYDYEKTFDTCRNPNTGKLLSFDFYLPDFDVVVEINDLQHYKYIPHFHKNDVSNFHDQQYRDKIKEKWANENNILFVEVKKRDFGRIEEILTDLLD